MQVPSGVSCVGVAGGVPSGVCVGSGNLAAANSGKLFAAGGNTSNSAASGKQGGGGGFNPSSAARGGSVGGGNSSNAAARAEGSNSSGSGLNRKASGPSKRLCVGSRRRDVCGQCGIAAYGLKARFSLDRGHICPNIENMLNFPGDDDAANIYFGVDYDAVRDCPADDDTLPENRIRIRPIGHQQFRPSLVVRNDFYGVDRLLDLSLPADRWLLLTSLPGGGAARKDGSVIPESAIKPLWKSIEDKKTHPLCKRIACLNEVKSWIDAEDIDRCSPEGCVFNRCAEALIRICRMRGISLETDLIDEAFAFQMELERGRRNRGETIRNARQAFVQLLDESVILSLVDFLKNLIQSLFATAKQSRRGVQSLSAKGISIDSIISAINEWIRLVEPGHLDFDFDFCLRAVLESSDLALSLDKYIHKIYLQIQLVCHSDRASNRVEYELLTMISGRINGIREEIRKFLVTGRDNNPNISNEELALYRRTTAVASLGARRCEEATLAHNAMIDNRAWAVAAGGASSEEIRAAENINAGGGSASASSTDITIWAEVSNALVACVPSSSELLEYVERAHNANPQAVGALVQNIVSSHGVSQTDAVIALTQLALIEGAGADELGDYMGVAGALVERTCPQAHDCLYPRLGQDLPVETHQMAVLAEEVRAGTLAEFEAVKDTQAQTAAYDIDIDVTFESMQNHKDKQEAVERTRAKMRSKIPQYANGVFEHIKRDSRNPENVQLFDACLRLFYRFKPELIQSILDTWNSASQEEREARGFVSSLQDDFAVGLKDCDFDCRAFLTMGDTIKRTVHEIKYSNARALAVGCGRRANSSKKLEKFDKYALPSENGVFRAVYDDSKNKKSNGYAELIVRAADLASHSENLYGYPYKRMENLRDPDSKIKTKDFPFVRIRVFPKPVQGLIGREADYEETIYVAFCHDTIAFDGRTVTCMTLDRQTLPIVAETCSFHKSLTRMNGRIVKDGLVQQPITGLKRFVNERLDDEIVVIPLVGVVRGGEIVEVWTGVEDEYNRILGKVMRENGCIFVRTNKMETVFDISKLKPTGKKSGVTKKAFRYGNETDPEVIDGWRTELFGLRKQLTHIQESDDAGVGADVDSDDDDDEDGAYAKPNQDEEIADILARVAWLESVIAKPPTLMEMENFESIDKALGKISLPYEVQAQLIQVVYEHFNFWIHPKDRVRVRLDRTAMIYAIESVNSELRIHFKDDSALYQLVIDSVESFFKRKQEAEVARAAVSVESGKREGGNNFTEAAPKRGNKKAKAPKKERTRL